MRVVRFSIGLITILCGTAASAVDGVNEINQVSILAEGGFPYTIPTKGSYRLTGDLIPPAGTGALKAGAANIEIDLNGFTIMSTGGAAANGIDSAGFGGLVVRNGLVAGFTGSGIVAGVHSKVIETKVSSNASGVTGASECLIVMNTINGSTAAGGEAVSAGACKIENNVIAGNTGVGIAGGANVIVHNRISSNTGGGIMEAGASTIQQNELDSNTGFGISDGLGGAPPVPPPVGPRTTIFGNTITLTAAGGAIGGKGISFTVPVLISQNAITGNAADGIVCGAGCEVNNNSVTTNNTGGAGVGGVSVADGSTVHGNSISYNTGVGLLLPAAANASYTSNTIVGNAPGPNVASPPTITGGAGNVCAPAACP